VDLRPTALRADVRVDFRADFRALVLRADFRADFLAAVRRADDFFARFFGVKAATFRVASCVALRACRTTERTAVRVTPAMASFICSMMGLSSSIGNLRGFFGV
jgi:hypothetical protein